ncbi:hypothetical protein EKO04_009519 [Ascochyta lentis]|uniref:RRM domain-containing protein n=1 Tax=Ascochyta lentis TaxID=205686 RepID=A0A8H7IWW2_9PLEO|nr:hypothetical protein EKO04_009519 [Ascochyta lentis]
MDHRRRASSTASIGLLSRQLASITDTLAKASQRRDAELKKVRGSAKVSPVTTVSDLRATKYAAKGTTSFGAPATSTRASDASHIGDNSRAMLAELESLRDAEHVSDSQSNDEGDDDIGPKLAELDRPASPPLTTATAPTDDDPRQKLTELAVLSVTGRREVSSNINEDEHDDDDDDINILRMRLQNLRSYFDVSPQIVPGSHAQLERVADHHAQGEIVEGFGARIKPEVMPYVIALELEHSSTQWEHAQRWATYLFGSGLNSYEAHKDRDIAVAHAEDALKKIICSVLEVEEGLRHKEEETKPQKRLVVSNLAAGADEQELERLFRKHRFEIVNIDLLSDRDPLRRTQTAHVDMSSREAAVQASYLTGHIYGLIVHIKLAVEQDG